MKGNVLAMIFLAGLIALTVAAHQKMRPAKRVYVEHEKGRVVEMENFRLLDQNGKSHELEYYSDASAIVLISQGNGCPIMRQSYLRIRELAAEFSGKGVIFMMLNANPQDNRDAILKESDEFGNELPILIDSGGWVARRLGIKRTVEAIVIRPRDRRILYRGAIDNRLGYETQNQAAVRHYLRDALRELLSGKSISVKRNEVKGCLIQFDAMTKKPVFTKDIAPILMNKCLACHIEGGIGPWAMTDYETIRGWGAMIAEVVTNQRMPPWHADPYYGRFRNERRLTEEEVRVIVEWVETGMPEGNGEDPFVKAGTQPVTDWPWGDPDLIISMAKEQMIPAAGIVDYRFVSGDQPVNEDLWVKAAYLKPSNKKVAHHAFALVARPDGDETKDGESAGADLFLSVYVPGVEIEPFPEGTGKFIPKGSRVEFEMHYTVTGKPETDRTQVGLYLYDHPPDREYLDEHIYDDAFIIPPFVKEHKVSAQYLFKQDAWLYSLQPHMHYRGKWMRYTAIFPDQNEEVLLSVPHYDFNWQQIYRFDRPKRIPAGTVIKVDGAFDNSVQNLRNPDPSAEVTYGEQSFEEMFEGFISYTIA